MGTRSVAGYNYFYEFSTVHEDDINSKYKSRAKPGRKGYLFEFRTNFILQTSSVGDRILDSETFDAHIHSIDDKHGETMVLFAMTCYRLLDYWMTRDEVISLVNEALTFANQKAAEPQCISLNIVPVVVNLSVYTVQHDDESLGDAMDRAIRAQNLIPLYLWPQPTTNLPPMSVMLRVFLLELDRIRVEDIEEGLAIMPVCSICNRKPNIGAQVSPLPCKHIFHSYCIVRWLEGKKSCPLCDMSYP